MASDLLITNCRIAGSSSERDSKDILIKDGRISKIAGRIQLQSGIAVFDAHQRFASPGFIDVHMHGGGGADVTDASEKSLETISMTAAQFGTTGFLATSFFKQKSQNLHLQCASSCVGRDLGGAKLLGIHLEGPFINPSRRGMIQPESICPPSPSTCDKIFEICGSSLRMMTIAPELTGCSRIIQRIVKRNVIASFGHSSATIDQTKASFDAGITHVTHLFNAMPSIHHRVPGPIPAILADNRVCAQIISDGVHIHPAVISFSYGLLGPSRTILITDGVQAMGLPDGEYHHDGLDYVVKNGAARYHDGTLIGTSFGMSRLLNKFASFTNCGMANAISAASINPARILGLANKGSVAAGKDADIAIIDDKYTVSATIVDGRIVYERPGK
jgi:N-acetylglucosamine-6-phosphate deacetylase